MNTELDNQVNEKDMFEIIWGRMKFLDKILFKFGIWLRNKPSWLTRVNIPYEVFTEEGSKEFKRLSDIEMLKIPSYKRLKK